MSHRIRVDLRILEFDFSPSEITTIIGLNPTRIWLKGELIHPNASAKYKENGWELSSGISQEEEFQKHIDALLNILSNNLDKLKSVCGKFYSEISCAVYIDSNSEESTPWIHLDKKAIAILAQLETEIDFDLYLT